MLGGNGVAGREVDGAVAEMADSCALPSFGRTSSSAQATNASPASAPARKREANPPKARLVKYRGLSLRSGIVLAEGFAGFAEGDNGASLVRGIIRQHRIA